MNASEIQIVLVPALPQLSFSLRASSFSSAADSARSRPIFRKISASCMCLHASEMYASESFGA